MRFFDLFRKKTSTTISASGTPTEPREHEKLSTDTHEEFLDPTPAPEEEFSVEERVLLTFDPGKTIREIATAARTYPELARHYLKRHNLPYKQSRAGRPKGEAQVLSEEKEDSTPREAEGDVSILVIPDAHAKPDVPNDRFFWLGKFIRDTRPTIVVCLGDFADMPSLSHYDIGKKSYEGRRYSLDLEASRHAQDLMFEGMGDYRPKRMVMTLGNHENRINRAIEEDSKLEGTVSIEDLNYEKYGWEVHKFKEIALVEGIAFVHYFPGGLMDRSISGEHAALTTLKKYHCSAFSGHSHLLKMATDVHMDGRRITAVVSGCYFNHIEEYVSKTVQKSYWRGLTVLHNVKNGEFDMEFVRLEQIERMYGREDIAA